MQPNPSLKRIYQELLEGNPTKAQTGKETGSTEFVHCLALHWPDGRRMIFYYAYLLSVELIIDTDHNRMILRFTSQTIILKGYGLETLFEQFTHEKPGLITVHDPRYVVTGIVERGSVIEASVKPSCK